MFNGTHIIVYSTDAEADRRFFRDVLKLGHVDVGEGWLIFAVPPAEAAFHPHPSSQKHELYFLCEDVEACRKQLAAAGVETAETCDEGWGLLSSFRLPGGGTIGFYQPRHATP